MKAILVVEMPKDCGDCKMIDCVNYDNTRARCKAMVYSKNEYSKYIGINDKPEWCPLKPIPKHYPSTSNPQRIECLKKLGMTEKEQYYYELGHDDCIDELLGEAE